MNQSDFRQCLLFAVTLSVLGPLSAWCENTLFVPSRVVDMVVKEVSPDAVERALGRSKQAGPSIHLDKLYQDIAPDKSAVRVTTCYGASRHQITGWYLASQPKTDRFVAVIAIVFDGPAILNPSNYFVYDGVPDLYRLNKSEADKLWGIPKKIGTNIFQYRLVSTNKNREIKKFLIQIRFGNEGVQQYRIVGPGIRHAGWQSVDNE